MTIDRRPGSAERSNAGEADPAVGKPLPHESARGHVTGGALYTDDLLGRFPKLLHAMARVKSFSPISIPTLLRTKIISTPSLEI